MSCRHVRQAGSKPIQVREFFQGASGYLSSSKQISDETCSVPQYQSNKVFVFGPCYYFFKVYVSFDIVGGDM